MLPAEKHRGFAFVQFEDRADAADAIDNMNNAELFGRVLRVNIAKPSAAVGGHRPGAPARLGKGGRWGREVSPVRASRQPLRAAVSRAGAPTLAERDVTESVIALAVTFQYHSVRRYRYSSTAARTCWLSRMGEPPYSVCL